VAVTAEPGILHADLDAFYASVEQLDDPSLRGRPVIVGGTGARGVVAAASYEARRFGVHSAMPTGRARRACPDGVFLSPRFERYAQLSRSFMEILQRATPLVEPLALDEAFLDVRGSARILGPGRTIAADLRRSVRDELGLAVSIGVATTKFVAKLASDLAKPDGMLVVEPGTELALLHPLAVERLFGVGPKTRARLTRIGLRTIGDVAHASEQLLTATVGPSLAAHLIALSWNRDERSVEPSRERKSIGHEETFPRDLTDRDEMRRALTGMSKALTARLRAAEVRARTVQLKVRFVDFRTVTRSRTLPEPTDLAAVVTPVVHELLDGVELDRGVRLLGVSGQQLRAVEVSSPSLLDEPETSERDAALEATVDAVRARFGTDALLGARRSKAPESPGEPRRDTRP
jgi:DNA polymerase-4